MRIARCPSCEFAVDEASADWDRLAGSGLCPRCGQSIAARAAASCSSCGDSIRKGAAFCAMCGTRVPSVAEEIPRARGGSEKRTALIKCPDCDGDVSTLAAACPHCGRPTSKGPDFVPRTVLGLSSANDEEMARLRKIAAREARRSAPRQESTSSGVFWGLFHFFITLPILLFSFFALAAMCVGSIPKH